MSLSVAELQLRFLHDRCESVRLEPLVVGWQCVVDHYLCWGCTAAEAIDSAYTRCYLAACDQIMVRGVVGRYV